MKAMQKAGLVLTAALALASSLQTVASADSIWNDTSTATLFTERRPTFVIGGLITVMVSEEIAALQRATLIAQKQVRNDHRWQFPQGFKTGAPQLQGQFRAENQLQSNNLGTTTRNGEVTFTITARIEDILPNGNLIITAHKNMRVNDEDNEMILTGIVRQNDVMADNTVASAKIADMRIDVMGTGPVSAKATGGIMTRIFNFLL
ncbi:MAG: flagellar basal body L-ring protein FlgH [Candidatus Sericytochromatia bacterium]